MSEEEEGYINNIKDLSRALDLNPTRSDLEREIQKAVYKGTSCGACARLDHLGVTFGSIIEGYDECATERVLLWGEFTPEMMWLALTEIEQQVDEIIAEHNQ